MADPLTVFTVSTLTAGLWEIAKEAATTLAGGVGGNRVDSLVYNNWLKLRENLKLYRPDANHDLLKAISRSYHQATLQICALRLDKIGENTDTWFRRELLPSFLSKPLKLFAREKFVTLDLHSERALLKAMSLDLLGSIKALEQQKDRAATDDDNKKLALLLDEYELLLRPESGADREAMMRERLTNQVISELSEKYGAFTPAFEQLLRERWFELLCACFQYYLKHKQEVANIFTGKLLAEMRVADQQRQLSTGDVEERLAALGGEPAKRIEQAHAWLPEEMRQGFERIEILAQTSLAPLLAMARENETRLEMLLLLVRSESQRVIDEVKEDAEHKNEILIGKLDHLESQLSEALKAAANRLSAVPRQLESPPADFTGREEELKDLFDKVKKSGVMISGLQGMGGIGKTALALKLADGLKADYPDGQIYLDLKGVISSDNSSIRQQPLTPSEIIRHVINAYLPTAKLPDSLDEQLGLYRSVLADKRALLLYDNAKDAAQLNQVIPPENCLLIVTSRQHFTLRGMYDKNLEKLKAEEARELLLKIEPRIGKQADTMADICDYLPIALRAAASALKNRRSLSPEELIKRFEDKKKLLKMVDESRSLSIEAAFELSYELLGGELQQHWRRLSVFPDTFDASAAAAVWELKNVDEAKERLEEIEQYSLLEWNAETKRYSLHDLARDFAGAKLSDEERTTAQRRHSIHYQQVLARVGELYAQGHEALVEGLRIFDWELKNIETGHSWAANHSRQSAEAAELYIDYANYATDVLLIRQHPREFIRWQDIALFAAQQLDNRLSQSIALGRMGLAYKDLGEVQKAIEYFEQALAISRQIGNRRNEGIHLGSLGLAYKESGKAQKAVEYFEQALAISREIGDRLNEGNWLGNLGLVYKNSGEVRKAIEYYEQALAISREAGYRRGEGIHLGSLGLGYKDLGEVQKAIEYYEHALAISREIGDRINEGVWLINLGTAYEDLGEVQKAAELMEASLKIFEEIESPHAATVRQWLKELRGE